MKRLVCCYSNFSSPFLSKNLSMFQRTKHGVLPIVATFFTPSTIVSSKQFSSKSLTRNPKTKLNRLTNSHTSRRSTQLTRLPMFDSSPDLHHSSSTEVVQICSLLSHSVERTRNLDNLLKGFRTKLDSNTVLSILSNYRHLGRTNTLDFFSWAGSQLDFRFDDSVVEYMADFLCRRKLFDDLKCLLKTVSIKRGQVSGRTVSICIRFLGRQGRVNDALCLFDEMETQLNCKPNNLVFNNMLYVLCKKENSGEFIDVALSIFRRIESPDVYSYSNILVGLCKFGRLENALEVFEEMGRAGLVPTRSAVNVLIGELCELSANKEGVERVKVTNFRRPFTILVPNVGLKGVAILPATRIFWSMYHVGLLPSAFIINKLISELCRLRKIDEAADVLKVVEDKKLRCLDESYAIVIRALCEVRRVNEACQLLGKMLSLDLKPKIVVYNCVICLLCKLGRMDEADRLFEIMSKKRCSPDNVTYTALIHGYGVVHNWEAAYGALMEMLRMGWCPHHHTYSLVESLLKEHGQVDLFTKLERKIETQILLKHCKSGRLEAAYEKLSSMLERGFSLPIYVRDSFEWTFRKAGKWEMAHELLKKMDSVISEEPMEPVETS